MTKISFDVDFSKDSENILQEIQERAKAEVEKRDNKVKSSAYLSTLHEKVNEELKTDYKSVTDLIRALTPFASSSLKDKISSTSPTGRRKTVSMNKETYDLITDLLSNPKPELRRQDLKPNQTAIARETGVSVVQVRKVATGGYDKKFGGKSIDSPVNPPFGKKVPDSESESHIQKTHLLAPTSPAVEKKVNEQDQLTPHSPSSEDIKANDEVSAPGFKAEPNSAKTSTKSGESKTKRNSITRPPQGRPFPPPP